MDISLNVLRTGTKMDTPIGKGGAPPIGAEPTLRNMDQIFQEHPIELIHPCEKHSRGRKIRTKFVRLRELVHDLR